MTTDAVLMLAAMVDAALPKGHTIPKRMFGGLAFMTNGNMLCCASKNGLMIRVGTDAEAGVLERAHASPCMGTGRRMPGFIMIDPGGLETVDDVAGWLAIARQYVDALPPKEAGKGKGRKKAG